MMDPVISETNGATSLYHILCINPLMIRTTHKPMVSHQQRVDITITCISMCVCIYPQTHTCIYIAASIGTGPLSEVIMNINYSFYENVKNKVF